MYQEGRRVMAWVDVIKEIRPIENADSIECAIVRGWEVVIRKGGFAVGDHVVYVSIDSWVPHDLAPYLSRGQEPKEYNGVKGYRLRTMKLRGTISQGLLISIKDAHDYLSEFPSDEARVLAFSMGMDVSSILNIQKYEPPIPVELAGDVAGAFPTHLFSKTDEERVQNLDYTEIRSKGPYIVTEKLDGTSMTVFKLDGKVRVCSRNWELKESETNSFWMVVRSHNLAEMLPEGVCLQGELIGPGIQKNRYQKQNRVLRVFNAFNFFSGVNDLWDVVEACGLSRVPVLDRNYILPESVHDLLFDADGYSIEVAQSNGKPTPREGLVLRSTGAPSVSFKAISNKWLLKFE